MQLFRQFPTSLSLQQLELLQLEHYELLLIFPFGVVWKVHFWKDFLEGGDGVNQVELHDPH